MKQAVFIMSDAEKLKTFDDSVNDIEIDSALRARTQQKIDAATNPQDRNEVRNQMATLDLTRNLILDALKDTYSKLLNEYQEMKDDRDRVLDRFERTDLDRALLHRRLSFADRAREAAVEQEKRETNIWKAKKEAISKSLIKSKDDLLDEKKRSSDHFADVIRLKKEIHAKNQEDKITELEQKLADMQSILKEVQEQNATQLEKHEGKMLKIFKRIAAGLNAAEEETFDLTRRGRENWMNTGILEGGSG